MSKKIVIGILIVILVVIAAIVGVKVLTENNKTEDNTAALNNTNEIKENKNVEKNEIEEDDDEEKENNNKVLVVYYSAQSHTKAVAEKIADNLDADIFEIIPEEEYTEADLNWNDDDSRVTREHEDESLRDVKLRTTKVDDWEEYDTVLIGYPIWWGIAAWPVNTFVKENDFEGKTIYPFCTSASSGLGESGDLLEEEANSGDWKQGHRFSSNASDSDIEAWTDSLK